MAFIQFPTIFSLDLTLAADLQAKIDHKTKPLGALGRLEALALQVGLVQQTLEPTLSRPLMLVFAGDHGVVESGVSPFPQAVTQQMVMNFLGGGAAINVFSAVSGLALRIVDAGVNHVFAAELPMIHAKIGFGTRNFLNQSAMTADECEQALQAGADIVRRECADGSNVFAFGEMGIGNTSSASALMAVLLGSPVADCVGRGTGLDDAGLATKRSVIETAIAFHQVNAEDPFKVLATFGGFEIAMMVGAMLAAAEQGCLLMIDGFIVSAALLVASRLQPAIVEYCVFSHCSNESGHRLLLDSFEAKPLLDLGLRLGEGTGAALAYPLVKAAVAMLNDMASFESAQVSEKIN